MELALGLGLSTLCLWIILVGMVLLDYGGTDFREALFVGTCLTGIVVVAAGLICGIIYGLYFALGGG